MKTIDHSLERVYLQLCHANCGLAIAEMEPYLAALPDGKSSEALRVVREDYD